MPLAALVVVLLAAGCATSGPPPEPAPSQTLHGVASWYGEEFAGRTTANGEIFDPLLLTAAHRTLPFGTVLDVTNPKTSATVRVRVNDRGPYVGGRMFDLSYAAAKVIGIVESGSGDVDATIVRVGRGDLEPPVPYEVTTDAPKVAFPLPAESAPLPPVPAPTPAPVPAAVVATVPAPVPASVQPATARRQDAGNAAGTVPATRSSQAATPTGPAAAPAPAPAPAPLAPAPAVVDRVVVETLPAGAEAPVETRRQVSADGRKVETVAVMPGGATAPLPSAPGHSSAEALDARSHPGAKSTLAPAPRATGKFVVQVGAFAQQANAAALQRRLRELGQDSHIETRGGLIRVQIGPFETREQAIQARARLESAGVSAIILAATP
jgi:rare lipoprotein A